MWLREFRDDDVLGTKNSGFDYGRSRPKGSREHRLAAGSDLLASYRLSSSIIRSESPKAGYSEFLLL